MTLTIKKIGKSKYAYLAFREGDKVIQKYLGPTNDPDVRRAISARSRLAHVPEELRTLFWDTNLKNIHLKRNRRYIIERVLELGHLDAVEWLQKIYPAQTIIDILLLSKTLSSKSKNFWTLWFGVNHV